MHHGKRNGTVGSDHLGGFNAGSVSWERDDDRRDNKLTGRSPFGRTRPACPPTATWGRRCSAACRAASGRPGPEPGRRWSGTTGRAARVHHIVRPQENNAAVCIQQQLLHELRVYWPAVKGPRHTVKSNWKSRGERG